MNKTAIFVALTFSSSALAADQPQWGEAWTRNSVSAEKGLPADFDPGEKDAKTGTIDVSKARNVRWVARLGGQSYGTPIVAGGKVFVGTNNDSPRDERLAGDRGVLMCFDERDGRFLWQLALPKLERIKWADWRSIGITSTPVVAGNRAWLTSNRGEVMCLDTEGMANGNDGPFVDEGRLMAADGQPPVEPRHDSADIIWLLDMPAALKAEPHNAANGSPMLLGDLLYVSTSNGVEWTHDHVVHPEAPSLVVLDKNSGRLVARDDFGIGPDITHGQWSNPAMADVAGRRVAVYGAGNGVAYAFEPLAGAGERPPRLANLWRYRGDPAAQSLDRVEPDHRHDSKSYEVTGNPVFAEGLLYVIFTQEPYHKMKLGRLVCLDPSGRGDVTRTATRWTYDELGSASSTPAVAGGLVYLTGFDGRVHCLDAKTGKVQWVHEAGGPIWASPLVADGKVYFGTGKSYLWVLEAGRALRVLAKVRMPEIVHTTPTAANGLLYVATYKHLFAIGTPK